MIVLDANILIRAVLGRRVRHLLELYTAHGLRFYAPDVAFADALKYLPPLLNARQISNADVAAAVDYFRSLVEPVNRNSYELFEEEARQRLQGRDEDDWPVLATALAFSCAVWTEDTDFFGSGIAVWTSDRIEIFLKDELKILRANQE